MNKITTDRLFLREMNPDDFQALFQVLGDPETMWHYPYTFDGQHVRDWIERNMNRYRKDGRTCVLRNGTAGSEMAGLRPIAEDIKGEAEQETEVRRNEQKSACCD